MKMAVFRKEMTALGQLFPHPTEGYVTSETPPVFTFLGDPEISDYTVRVYDDKGELAWEGKTAVMAIVPEKILPPGAYTWDVIANAGTTAEEHQGLRSFRIAADAVPFLRPDAAEIWDAIPDCHPRHLFTRDDLPLLRERHTRELAVLRRNVALAYADGLPTPPRFHRDPDALAYREYFGRHRDYCDRNLVACALAYHLLDEQLQLASCPIFDQRVSRHFIKGGKRLQHMQLRIHGFLVKRRPTHPLNPRRTFPIPGEAF